MLDIPGQVLLFLPKFDMDLKKFTAVHFIEDNSFEVVPSTWISECQGQAKFPANKPKGFLKLQEQFDAVAEKNWPVWRIEILKSYGNQFV